MNDYKDFPPISDFKRVLTICPNSALIHCQLWKIKDRNNRIIVPLKEVKKKLLLSPTLLRNHLLSLARVDILTFEETTDFFLIDFANA